MNCKKNLTGLIFLVAMITLHSCSPKMVAPVTVRSSYTKEEISAIESNSFQGFRFLQDSLVQTRSIHDADSIWFEIRISNPLVVRSVIINGMAIFFDPEAKKNQEYGIAIPAARAEMLRRKESVKEETTKQSTDTLAPEERFEPTIWIEAIRRREAVVTDTKGTRFATKETMQLFMDDNNELVYKIRLAFEQIGVSGEDVERISIGIISDLHQAQLSAPQGGGIATRPNISDRNRQQQPRQNSQPRSPGMSLIAVEAWQVLLINEELTEEQKDANNHREGDDVYR